MSQREKLLAQFRSLVVERLGRITESVMALESGGDKDACRAALRELHGLKGEARMMGFAEVNTLVHEMEELVRLADPTTFTLSSGSADALLVAADAVLSLSGATPAAEGVAPPNVEQLVQWLKQCATAQAPKATSSAAAALSSAAAVEVLPSALPPPKPLAAPPAPAVVQKGTRTAAPWAPPPASSSVDTPPSLDDASLPAVKGGENRAAARGAAGELRSDSVRVDVETLERMSSAVTGLSQLARRRQLGHARRFGLVQELAELSRIAEELGPAGAAVSARLVKAKDLMASLHREAKLLANEEMRDLSWLSEEIQSLRMLPLSVLFAPYTRMVRDLARELGKEVELSLQGGDVKAERGVVEALRDPLLHLVRNALDHGLEGRAERVDAGKAPRGTLTIRASREGERLVLTISDDGVGLDPVRLRKTAVRRGLHTESSAQALPDAATFDLIFQPGFSTREVANDLSGRGVGLEVVRSQVQALGGDVSAQSTLGEGTRFELSLPVSLTVAPLLFVASGEERMCLMASSVDSALRVQAEQIRSFAGRPALSVDEELIPFASLAALLGQAPHRPATPGELVLCIKVRGTRVAIAVERVLEERVQPILPVGALLRRYTHLTGATARADGSLALVLAPAQIVRCAQEGTTLAVSRQSTREKSVKRRVLIVDDSPLTRELLASLLDSVGYEIRTADDGVEALAILQREGSDLVVTDLEMPRMDGLELTRQLKSHATLRGLPVVLVTTRGGEADRRKGMEAGADAYIAKGDLARQDLVDVVGRLLG